MTLLTNSKLPNASPLTDIQFDHQNRQEQHAKVALSAITRWQHLHLRGQAAESALARVYDMPEMAIGRVISVSDGVLARLRRDEFLLLTADLPAAMERLEAKPDEALLTLTDITHGRVVIGLVGARAQAVLAKICGLDFGDGQFPNGFAAQTSLAKVRTLIIRMDVAQAPAYYLMVDRSLAVYLWEVVYDAAQEFDGFSS